MNKPKPFDREEAFRLYLSLLENAGSEAQLSSPSSISVPLATTAISLAQAFQETIERYQITTPSSLYIQRFSPVQAYGEFLVEGKTVYLQTWDGDRQIIAEYQHQSLSAGVACHFNSFLKNPAILDDE